MPRDDLCPDFATKCLGRPAAVVTQLLPPLRAPLVASLLVALMRCPRPRSTFHPTHSHTAWVLSVESGLGGVRTTHGRRIRCWRVIPA